MCSGCWESPTGAVQLLCPAPVPNLQALRGSLAVRHPTNGKKLAIIGFMFIDSNSRCSSRFSSHVKLSAFFACCQLRWLMLLSKQSRSKEWCWRMSKRSATTSMANILGIRPSAVSTILKASAMHASPYGLVMGCDGSSLLSQNTPKIPQATSHPRPPPSTRRSSAASSSAASQ